MYSLYFNPVHEPDCPCSDSETGWTRVAYFDGLNEKTKCPYPNKWELITDPVRGCKAHPTKSNPTAIIYTSQIYSRVCGRVNAIQKGTTDAFITTAGPNLQECYLDGVSITHGTPRQHIWSFAAANFDEVIGEFCNCNALGFENIAYSNEGPPSFVGNNYFCDTGNHLGSSQMTTYFLDDPLWDGQGCNTETNTCCELNNPPWFCTTLAQPTSDDIEVRICHDQDEDDENVIVTYLSIFIK